MDLTRYYAGVRAHKEALIKQYPSGYCLMVSVFNLEKNSTAGNACEVSVAEAARLLADGTHRLANEAEDKAFCEHQEKARLESARLALRSNVLHEQITDVVRKGLTVANLMAPDSKADIKPPSK